MTKKRTEPKPKLGFLPGRVINYEQYVSITVAVFALSDLKSVIQFDRLAFENKKKYFVLS